MVIEMAEGARKVAGTSSIEGWTKNQKKQLRISAWMLGFILDKFSIEDVSMKIMVNTNSISFMKKIIQWAHEQL
jgi:hypothetical protein